MKRILIVEEQPLMSAGTCQMMSKLFADVAVSQADTFWGALQIAGTDDFDLVVMEIAIPGGNSVQMIDKFRTMYPTLRLLIFSVCDESIYALPYVKAGANGFVSKKASEAEFRLAVETVLFSDRVYLSDRVRSMALDTYLKPHARSVNPIDSLSIREREISQLLYARKGVTEIALSLNISTSTVNTHRVRIFKKMGVDNIFDLVRKYELLSQRR